MKDELEDYLSGRKLCGDDFDRQQVEAWNRDELEAYANSGAKDVSTYRYQ